ncbi:PaaI family thioesterase [Beggiatoa leptomitoformis]|uniref:PaaI family thioesterase n=1 Tax=Beggiatoa leptomitoformis TaxID=288004 RepID=A0A2N9YIH9_9GAMM|nr:PaaI family thioesterase [Beggiatoa leptomitoformis]ALG69372.2 PaaI family thioesterase [Beggiatoa leptomitoformis]AUI70300.1 PaaI family thioesterase [Beggiatoa leptomitoformis]
MTHTPLSGLNKEELQRIIDEKPFLHVYGFQVDSVSEGVCVLRVPFNHAFERPGGVVSGPLYMAAADAAMWFAILTKLRDAEMSVTSEMTTAFLKGAKEEDFLCKAKLIKVGGRIIFGTAKCMNLHGELLTHHTLSYIRRGG